mmetsp:Transcript_14760/g.44574  ORF Transcript_14760/g.44574 Transcript_14760/m.44574 type:complete len:866 (+) Transcript_14760:431-3028(+)
MGGCASAPQAEKELPTQPTPAQPAEQTKAKQPVTCATWEPAPLPNNGSASHGATAPDTLLQTSQSEPLAAKRHPWQVDQISSGSPVKSGFLDASPRASSGKLQSSSLADYEMAAATSSKVSTIGSTGSSSSRPTSGHHPELDHKIIVEDALAQAMQLPYSVFASGPYTPPCNEERVAYSNSLNLMDSPPDPQVAHILTSLSKVFSTSSVLLTLCGQQRVWIRNAIGFAAGDFEWRWAFCGWSLAPPSPTVLVIEDTHQDARFRDNLVVTGEPHIRNFAGSPLVASNGHRLGTLCFLGPDPRKFTAEEMVILVNMAELVVRELEKQAVMDASAEQSSKHRHDSTVDVPLPMYMMRSVACFTGQSVAFVDTHQPLWQMLHCNMAFSEATDLPFNVAIEAPFWELFQPPFAIGSEAWQAAQEMVAQAGEFVVKGCFVPRAPDLGPFTLSFRPADRSALDGDTQPVGVPSDVPSAPDSGGRYYFCLVTSTGSDPCSRASVRSASYSSDGQALPGLKQQEAAQTPVTGLKLGALLGKGSFGQVYRGVYNGQAVAVKVCSGALRVGRGKRNKPWAGVEAVAARNLDHPGIVRTLKHTAIILQEGQVVGRHNGGDSAASGSDSAWADEWFDEGDPNHPDFDGLGAPAPITEMETWIILEYCDRGTLQSGIDKGFFRMQRTCRPPSEPNLAVVMATAIQLADALSYLHSRDIIHGDLTGGNILLTHDDEQPHGFSCKVADFGLSRGLDVASVLQTKTYGTVTHMPPELLTEGQLSKAADAYAFGTILWEMYHGVRAYCGMSHTQVLAAVAIEGKSLKFAKGSHKGLEALAAKCHSPDPLKRPTFPEIKATLEHLQQQLPPPASAAAAPSDGLP